MYTTEPNLNAPEPQSFEREWSPEDAYDPTVCSALAEMDRIRRYDDMIDELAKTIDSLYGDAAELHDRETWAKKFHYAQSARYALGELKVLMGLDEIPF